MPERPDFVEHVLDLLSAWGGVSARRMFGGYGLYRAGRMFGLISDERLYLKTDDDSRAAFEAAGTHPFTYRARGRAVSLSYWEAPAELLDDADAMAQWARRALQAATATPGGHSGHNRPRPARRQITKS